MKQTPRIVKGQPIKADELDAIGQNSRAAGTIKTVAPLFSRQTTAGTVIWLEQTQHPQDTAATGSTSNPKIVHTAPTDTWNRNTDKRAVKEKVMGRVAYTSDYKLKQFWYWKIYDSNGNLFDIGAECAEADAVLIADTSAC